MFSIIATDEASYGRLHVSKVTSSWSSRYHGDASSYPGSASPFEKCVLFMATPSRSADSNKNVSGCFVDVFIASIYNAILNSPHGIRPVLR